MGAGERVDENSRKTERRRRKEVSRVTRTILVILHVLNQRVFKARGGSPQGGSKHFHWRLSEKTTLVITFIFRQGYRTA